MAGIKLANGNPSNSEMTVTADGNANVVLPTVVDLAGFATLAAESDAGTVLVTRTVKALEATKDHRLRVGTDSVLFDHSFEGTNIARDRLTQINTTATAAQTTGQLTINSGGSVTSGQACQVRTYRSFPLFGTFTTYGEIWAAHANATATNVVSEFGFGYVSAALAQATDGVFFRIASGGTLRAVVVNNGTDVSVVDIDTTSVPPRDGVGTFDFSETNRYLVAIHNDQAEYWINDVLVSKIPVTSTFGSPTQASQQPLFARVYNAGTASSARTLILRKLSVTLGEVNASRPWSHQMAGIGGGSYQIQPGTASGPTVTRGIGSTGWPTSATARAAGTWTATSAPAIGSLGGQWLSPAISTLASEADYPIFSYQNPTGTATLPGRTLYITGVRWGKTVATAAAATNSITLQYILGVGSNSATTSASDAATVVAARGIALDLIPFKATAVVGDYVEGGSIDFSEGPLAIYPGFYVSFIVRPFGTVTSNTLVVNGTVAFVGYHE